MSRYNKLIKNILDSILEGYALDKNKKLKVVNEAATKAADAALHKLVLEKSRDLWDQLEAAEDSLTGVAEEISFEELNMDPSSVDMTLTAGGNEPSNPEVDAAAVGAEPTLENLLGSDDFDLSSVFEQFDVNEPPMADGGPKDEPTMMDSVGEEEDVIDGDEDYENLKIGMDDADMGSSDMEGDMDYDENGENGDNGDMDYDENGEPGLDGEIEGELDLDPEEGEIEGDATFDFDLGLGDEDIEGEFGDENALGDLGPEGEFDGEEEDELTDEGYGAKSYRMETKGKK